MPLEKSHEKIPTEACIEPILATHASASSSLTVVANMNQKDNPLLQYLKELRVEFARIVPDYLLSQTDAVLFISLKFFRLHPHYLEQRISEIKEHTYRSRILLCCVDLPDYEVTLERVILLAFRSCMSFVPAWSPAEATKLLETFKQVLDKPVDSIQAKLSTNYEQRITDILTTITSISKIDSSSLMREFGTFRRLLQVMVIFLVFYLIP